MAQLFKCAELSKPWIDWKCMPKRAPYYGNAWRNFSSGKSLVKETLPFKRTADSIHRDRSSIERSVFIYGRPITNLPHPWFLWWPYLYVRRCWSNQTSSVAKRLVKKIWLKWKPAFSATLLGQLASKILDFLAWISWSLWKERSRN